ncbi:MAG: hypothetical protein KF841_13110 [Phycisphaerae bacterium]|nr:hypothetical protein [Phycisphaerae bacterium]
MHPEHLTPIDSLAAPSDDGGILIWPAQPSLVNLAERNRARRTRRRLELAGRLATEWMAAGNSPPVDSGPLVFMTGHQPEFFHAGVWAKTAAMSALALASAGRGVFLIVDSDVPNRLAIDWPDDSSAICRIGSVVSRGAGGGLSYEHLGARATEQIALSMRGIPDEIRPGASTAISIFRDAFGAMEKSVTPSSHRSPYVSSWIRGVQAVDAAVGLSRAVCICISDVFEFGSEAVAADAEKNLLAGLRTVAAAFVVHLASNAPRLANAYNESLRRYRERQGIRGRQHPIPDLYVDSGLVELPFWWVSRDRPRSRLFAATDSSGAIRLMVDGAQIGSMDRSVADGLGRAESLAASLPSGLRPRALAQTMFARLFACDLFIHGIGGAKYDSITDGIIRTFFGVEPPEYACVTATLRLPTRTHGVTPLDLATARRQSRDLRYNPQRYLDEQSITEPVRQLLVRRAEAIDRSNLLHSGKSEDRQQRQAAYRAIRQANAQVIATVPEFTMRVSSRLSALEAQFASDRLAQSREWFFALHTVDALRELADGLSRRLGV